jgi:actin-related protein
MSSYETLLENYNLEEKYANDSFSNMMACFESLNAFANEDVNFEVVVSLEEAESGKIKDTAGKIKEAAKRTAKAIEKKVSEFIVKIKDALSRFIAKAKITVANKGNAALKKMIGNSELVIGKDIKLKYFKKNKSNAYVFGQVDKAIKKVSELVNNYPIYEEADLDNLRVTVDVLGDNVATSSIVEEIVLKASDNMKVKEAVTKYVDPLLKDTTDNLNNAQKTVNETIKTLKANIKDLKKETASMDKNSEEAKINKEDMSGLRECISLLMKVSTRYINYVGTVLVMGASNASKIALAAVDAKGKSVAGKFAKKEKEEAAATK